MCDTLEPHMDCQFHYICMCPLFSLIYFHYRFPNLSIYFTYVCSLLVSQHHCPQNQLLVYSRGAQHKGKRVNVSGSSVIIRLSALG